MKIRGSLWSTDCSLNSEVSMIINPEERYERKKKNARELKINESKRGNNNERQKRKRNKRRKKTEE
jgi:hypothetical protein